MKLQYFTQCKSQYAQWAGCYLQRSPLTSWHILILEHSGETDDTSAEYLSETSAEHLNETKTVVNETKTVVNDKEDFNGMFKRNLLDEYDDSFLPNDDGNPEFEGIPEKLGRLY